MLQARPFAYCGITDYTLVYQVGGQYYLPACYREEDRSTVWIRTDKVFAEQSEAIQVAATYSYKMHIGIDLKLVDSGWQVMTILPLDINPDIWFPALVTADKIHSYVDRQNHCVIALSKSTATWKARELAQQMDTTFDGYLGRMLCLDSTSI